ncbi:hypothetical protein Q757_07575 [Oenococcus alcoholitolerans]|uniref:Uncharacterized protein n=1 Tax=Oenococcus alcoholitolerans TaxID=931074 RepID=A0ABR4XPV7_9LACO|nr:hypothetical protein Q757_07575 [Oenococcus alcoholitolerans]
MKKKVLALNKHNDGYDLSSIAVYLLQKIRLLATSL